LYTFTYDNVTAQTKVESLSIPINKWNEPSRLRKLILFLSTDFAKTFLFYGKCQLLFFCRICFNMYFIWHRKFFPRLWVIVSNDTLQLIKFSNSINRNILINFKTIQVGKGVLDRDVMVSITGRAFNLIFERSQFHSWLCVCLSHF